MINIIRSISDLGVLVVIAGIYIWVSISDRKEYRQSQTKWMEESTKISDKLANIIATNTVRLDNFEDKLKDHSNTAENHFDTLGSKIEMIDSKLETLQETTKELATRQMAEEIKKEVRNLKKD
ncbi:hypothetical protein [uncultured Anaerococcus sp.]|uniref:hypothetical protein n=1 Tax=uncultured Anaerococcus sp. TaxID=293428 RepID=UPI00288C346E|nr:hypothetical protein [uncultured Anaerococcus sp.]